MEEQSHNNDNHHQKLSIDEKEDRLIALPHPILIDILSLLPINTSATTSILSRKWRNLWTEVTSFEFHFPNRKLTSSIYPVFYRLKSRTIHKISLTCDKNGSEVFLRNLSPEIVSISNLRDRKVEEVKVISHILSVSACLFQCKSLNTIELDVPMDCKFATVMTVDLPNLKRFRLCCGQLNSFRSIAKLCRSCPLLEDLSLTINELHDRNVVEIVAPNLKLLSIELKLAFRRNEIAIDAPMLVDLKITDRNSLYRFDEYPRQLVNACVEFTHELNPWEDEGMDDSTYLRKVAKFVHGLSSVSNLQLKRNMKLFTYLDSGVGGAMPVFHNLSCFKTTLNRHLDVDDFLLSLQCAPNLEELEVIVEHRTVLNFEDCCARGCFLSQLKTVKIWGLQGYDDEVSMLKFILKHAIVLEELRVMVDCISFGAIDSDDEVSKENKFCEAFFKLPRSSSTSKLVFSGEHINATSNAVE